MGRSRSSNSGNQEAVRLQNEQVEKQYQYDKKMYKFDWDESIDPATGQERGQMWRTYNHGVQGLEIQKNNDEINKAWQEETSNLQWEHGKNQQDWQFEQSMRMYRKSEKEAGRQKAFNEEALTAGLDRETEVLNEQFINTAFENQKLVQDLFEAVGGKGFDQASLQLGLHDTKGQLDVAQLSENQRLQQFLDQSRMSTAGVQLGMIDKQGKTNYNRASIVQGLQAKEAQNKFNRLDVELTQGGAKSRAEYENDVIRRSISDTKYKAAFNTTEANIKALNQLGNASLTQSGRSQGKAIQMVLAQLGRQNAYTVENIIRGKSAAEAKARQNKIQALNTEARAEVAKKKIDFNTLDNISKAKMQVDEANRDLSLSDRKSELDLDKIKQQISHAADQTDLKTRDIARNLENAQTKAGLGTKKIDWDVKNVGHRFRANQDILQAQLESAIKSSLFSKQDMVRSKFQADLEVEARRLLDPSANRLEYAPKPLDLPDLVWQDHLKPELPPEPIKGAMSRQVSSGGSAFASGMSSVLGGVSTGFAVAGGLSSLGMVGMATPLGIAAGLGSMFF